MRQICTKTFEFEEGSTANMGYHVTIYFCGRMVDRFERETMQDAINAAEAAGYDGIRSRSYRCDSFR